MRVGLALAAGIAAAVISTTSGAASVPAAYCPLPPGSTNPSWGFHVGAPIQAVTGTYAHGRGTLTGGHAAGAICQVDRSAGAPDRQIVLSVTHGAVNPQHAVTVNGVLGNRMSLPVRVSSTTDTRCHVGTQGTVTLFSSYNGVHRDTVDLTFPRACRDHDHHYSGPHVVALVPA
jgi:hypothetical protein